MRGLHDPSLNWDLSKDLSDQINKEWKVYMTKITRTFYPDEFKLVPLQCPYRSRLALAMELQLDDQKDKEKLEAAWSRAVKASFDNCGDIENQKVRMPTLDEAMHFIAENPGTTARILETMEPISVPQPPAPPPIPPTRDECVKVIHDVLKRNGYSENQRFLLQETVLVEIARAGYALRPECDPSLALIPRSALDWLMGDGVDKDGNWFHDIEDRELKEPNQRTYWWRAHLRELFKVGCEGTRA